MGHLAHKRNSSKSINTSVQRYGYTIILLKRENIISFKKYRIMFFICDNLSPLHQQYRYSNIQIFEQRQRIKTANFNQIASPKDALYALYQILLKLWRFFLSNIINVFPLFHYYLSLEKGVALHLNKFEFPSSRDALRQIGQNLACGSRIFFYFISVCLLFRYHLPLEKRRGPSLE